MFKNNPERNSSAYFVIQKNRQQAVGISDQHRLGLPLAQEGQHIWAGKICVREIITHRLRLAQTGHF